MQGFRNREPDLSVSWLIKMSWWNLRLWHEFVPPAFMCLGAIIDFCVEPRRACPTSQKKTNPHTHTHTQTHTHTRAQLGMLQY